MSKENKKIAWYNSGSIITNLIIGIIVVIIIFSQSFALGNNGSLELFSSIINHNSVYLFILVYFILLKTPFGKKNFNYINILLLFIYFITTITSFLTVVQSFSLNTVLDFVVNFMLLLYASHTLFRDSRIWKDLHLDSSPFNELSNEWYFYTVVVISVFLLAVNLINTIVVSGVVLSILDTIYLVLFGRYIYLYREYLEKSNKTVKEQIENVVEENKDMLEDLGKKIVDTTNEVVGKVDKYIKDNEIDKKATEMGHKVVEKTDEVVDKVGQYIKDNEIDKKASEMGHKVVEKTDEVVTTLEDIVRKDLGKSKKSEVEDNSKKTTTKKTTTKKTSTTKKSTTKKDSNKKGDK